ncbi:MAG: CARDB domain-containing protein, partial [Nitrososphaera sp.]
STLQQGGIISTLVSKKLNKKLSCNIVIMMPRGLENPFFRIGLTSFFTIILFVAIGLPSARSADAAFAVSIHAAPSVLFIGDAHPLTIVAKVVNTDLPLFIDDVIITTDPGTVDERVYHFGPNGEVISVDTGFIDIIHRGVLFTDGYAIHPGASTYFLSLDVNDLAVGEHTAELEINTIADVFTDTTTFTLRSKPASLADLEINSFNSRPTSQRGAVSFAIIRETNDGSGNAGGHRISIYLSSDTTLSADDKQVGRYFISFLGEGKSKTFTVQTSVPRNYAPGPEYLLVYTDAANQVSELSELNNQEAKLTRIS